MTVIGALRALRANQARVKNGLVFAIQFALRPNSGLANIQNINDFCRSRAYTERAYDRWGLEVFPSG